MLPTILDVLLLALTVIKANKMRDVGSSIVRWVSPMSESCIYTLSKLRVILRDEIL